MARFARRGLARGAKCRTGQGRDGAQRTLYASDAGEPMSAATVAVAKGNLLIAGSVTDDGLMLCHLSEAGG